MFQGQVRLERHQLSARCRPTLVVLHNNSSHLPLRPKIYLVCSTATTRALGMPKAEIKLVTHKKCEVFIVGHTNTSIATLHITVRPTLPVL